MPDKRRVIDLTFSNVTFGKNETPWDLKVLLYRGGAKSNPKKVANLIANGILGELQHDRLPLVQALHEVITDRLAAGGSRQSACTQIETVRRVFHWAESMHLPLDLDNFQTIYLRWTDWLIHRIRVIGDIQENSAYGQASTLGSVLDEVLNRKTPIIERTGLQPPSNGQQADSTQSDKQNLEATFRFGHVLQDICDSLSNYNLLTCSLPLRIPLRFGPELEQWSGWNRPANRKLRDHRDTPQRRYAAKVSDKKFSAWESDGTIRTRYPLLNLRLEAEMLMFIGQTGMNLTQANEQKMCDFYYASHIDGYQVRNRKARRGGDVLFEIFKEYKNHFERYLAWRREMFPNSLLLFPFVLQKGRSERKPPKFNRIHDICDAIEISFIPPSTLRNTRVNWLYRRSGDKDLTSELAQHTKQTLITQYLRPHQQRAISEITRFWENSDPTGNKTVPPAPGVCDGEPVPIQAMPASAPQPDCIQPSGCLWCRHHRDIDSQDYVWSIACFRHLKIIEVSKWHPAKNSKEAHPGEFAIDRISEKLRWFYESNKSRRQWVDEALARVEEGTYHPNWHRLIENMEGSECH